MKSICRLLFPAVFLAGTAAGNSATLTGIPVGFMVHASVGYVSAEQRLAAHVDPIVPGLVPLDVSYPADNFDPAHQWYRYLDPSQQGMAYSRQYGLVVDSSSDPIPSDMSIWFRLVSRTSGLGLYNYRQSGQWAPMLGTEGSTNLFVWNLAMFHPGIAATPGDGTHSAVLEAFAVDVGTGTERNDIAPARFTLQWTNTPSVRALRLGPGNVLCWSQSATNYVLETTGRVDSAAWVPVTNKPALVGAECQLPLSTEHASGFYRLRRIP